MPQPSTCPCHLFFRPPRQQLLQLHAPAICFSGGSRLPFARPQTLQTLPQASKATTLTATCPCHLFFKGFKTAVCPPSNPPNASAGHQGNNSYSYMPLPSVFQWVQDCRLPALKPSKRFRNPPRQQLLQLHPPAICFSGVQDCCLPGLKPSKPFRRFKTAVCPPSNPPNASAGLQGNNSYSYMPLPSVFQRFQDCRLPALWTCGRVWRVWGRANSSLEPLKNRWQGDVAVRVVALEGCGSVWRVWGRANGSLETAEKQRAGACSCKSCCLGGLRKRLEGLRAGKRQSWTPWKTDGRGM